MRNEKWAVQNTLFNLSKKSWLFLVIPHSQFIIPHYLPFSARPIITTRLGQRKAQLVRGSP